MSSGEDRPICRRCDGDKTVRTPPGYSYEWMECPDCDGTGFVERRTEHPEVRSALDAMDATAREPFVALLRWYDDLTDKQLERINAQSKIIQEQAKLLHSAEQVERHG